MMNAQAFLKDQLIVVYPIAGGDLPTVGKSPGANPYLTSWRTRELSRSGGAGLF
jgi:hypothetical protein